MVISMSEKIEDKIEEVLDQVRPALNMDGGGIEFVAFEADTGKVHVRFQGACVGCPMSEITLKMGVEAALQEALPEIKEVIAVE
jgi:Fe-S cluster biogenesis protein NfuA